MKPGTASLYLVGGVCVTLLVACKLIPHTMSALLTSLILAFLVNPLLARLEARKFGRIKALAVIYVFFSASIVFAALVLLPRCDDQLQSFFTTIPTSIRTVVAVLGGWRQKFASVSSGGELTWLIGQVEDQLNALAVAISGKGYEWIKTFVFGLFNLIIAPVLVFFMLFPKEYFKELFLLGVPDDERVHLLNLGGRIYRALERFVFAQLIDCLLVGVLCIGVLVFFHIDFPVLNGFFAGIASAVPLVGTMVAIIPPLLLGYAKSGDMLMIGKLCTAYFVIMVIIEGNLIKPLVMRGMIRLNPLAVIAVVMVMGEFLGFWGIVLAIPFAIVVKICAGEVKALTEKGPVAYDPETMGHEGAVK